MAKTKKDEVKLPAIAAAQFLLLKAGHPMHYREITRAAAEEGLLKLKGATPERSMRAYFAKDLAADNPTFVRLDPGVFDLADRDAARKALMGRKRLPDAVRAVLEAS